MKKIVAFIKVFFVVLLISPTTIFAESNLSEADLEAIYGVIDYRPELTTMTPNQALKAIAEYRNNLLSDSNQSKFSEQGLLILDGLLALEEVTYLYNMNSTDPNLRLILFPLNNKLESWIKQHNPEEISPWLYVVAGDLQACSIRFYSVTNLLDVGLTIKKYYENALKEDPNLTEGNLSLAQWYFYAPTLGGGSKKKSRQFFEKALATATTPAEKFYANLYYSQFLFDQKDKAGAKIALNKAKAVEPNSQKIDFIQMLNDNGYTLFYYTLNREKVDKKLGL